MPVSQYFGRGRRYNKEGTEAVNLDEERKAKQHKKSNLGTLDESYSKGTSTKIPLPTAVEEMNKNWEASKKYNPDRY